MIKAEHRAGERTIAPKTSETVRQAIDAYIATKENILSPSTIRGYTAIRDNRFKSVIDKDISSVKDWQAACNDEAKSCSAKTLKNAWMFVASALKHSGIDVPPVTLPQVVPHERLWLTPDEIKTFVKALHGTSFEIGALLALHGLRRSEIYALTWDNVDLKNNSISVAGSAVFDKDGNFAVKETNKNNSSRRVVPIMIPALKDALAAVEDKQGNVVRTNPTTLWIQVSGLCKKNGLPKVGVHSLRHSFASLAYHVGLSELETMRIGGWADHDTMRKIYTHLSDADKRRAENKIALFYQNC